MDQLINTIKGLPPQALLIGGVVIAYFLLNLLFPSKPNKDKTKEELEQEEIERTQKHKTNYTIRSYTSYREATNDVYRPKDGGYAYSKNSAGYKKINKINKTQETLARQSQYERLFGEKIRNLNFLARELEIINDQVVSDLKYFKTKKHLFLDVSVDIKNCRINYGDELDDEEIEDEIVIEEKEDNSYDENSYLNEDNEEDEEFFDEDEQMKVKCPKCGKVNIVDIEATEYRCFCCLSKNKL